MPSINDDTSSTSFDSEDVQEMAKYGIAVVPVNYFHYKEYRYTNLQDAISYAKRQHGK